MNAPAIISPSNPVPGLRLQVDLTSAPTSPGNDVLRALILSVKETGQGSLVVDDGRVTVTSASEVLAAIGRGPGYFAYKAMLANNPTALVDLIAPTASGGNAAAGTITFASTVTAAITYRLWIHGVQIDLPWLVGETPEQMKAKAVTLINQRSDQLMVVASAGSGGVVDLDARITGPSGNDIRIRGTLLEGAGGTVTLSGANLTGGTTEVDFTDALATAASREYDYIVVCTSNADAESASATSNPGRVKTHIAANQTGLNAKLQQAIVVTTTTLANAKTGAIGRNAQEFEHLCVTTGEGLSAAVAGAEAGDRMRRRSLSFGNANRIGSRLVGVVGAADQVAATPTEVQALDALTNGVTPVSYDVSGNLFVVRPITTRSLDAFGSPTTLTDCSEIDALYTVAKDLRSFLPVEFNQVNVVRDQPEDGTAEDLPAGTVEERDIRAAIATRMAFWTARGTVQGPAFAQAVADGTFQVNVNPSDPTQVDIFIPLIAVKPLAKMGVLVQKAG